MDFSSIAPIVQHVEKLPLEELNGRCGVFIVDVVGGDRQAALIKKGTLRFLERPTVNGQALLVLNEKNVVVSKERAAVWVDGVKYTRTAADDVIADLQPDEILIPFSTRSGRTSKQIILSDTTTGLCALKNFDHLSENYSFSCQIFVDREELIQFKTAHVLLRPSLHCNNTPSSVSLVENVIVTVKATDLDGIPTIKQFDDVVFVDNELTCLEVMIGDNLASFAVEVQGRVRIVSDLNRPQDVSASRSFHVNQINSSFGLRPSTLGRRRARSSSVLIVTSRRREDVEEDSPDQIVTVEGADTPIALPVRECDSDKLFLLSMTRDWTPLTNCSQFLTVKNGLIIISGRAPAGDYTLFNWTSGSTVRVSVIRSTQQLRGTTVIGRNKIGVCRRSATAIERVSQTEDGDVKIRLLNPTPSTRVHVFLSSFQPVFDAQTNLALSNRVEDSIQILPNSISQFNSNKRLGTEQLYVLNRRAQPHKLEQPSIRKDTPVRDKERFSDSRPDDSSAGQTSKTMKSSKRHDGSGEHDRFRTTDEGTLDWMKTASLVKHNIPVQAGPHAEILLAGKDELGGRTVCTVIVTDEDRTLCRRFTLTLPPQPSDADDTNRTEVRMMQPFDGLKHFVETNTASLILPQSAFDHWPPPTASTLPHPSYTMIGKRSIQIGDMSAVKHSQFASIRGLFHLMVSIFGAESSSTQFARLKKFEELFGQLGGLTESEKVKRYSQMPCHETNLFFFHKAPALATESQLLNLIKPNVFAELNALEQILVVEMLVSILIGTKDPMKTEQAQSYALNFLLTVKHRVTSRPENKEHDAKLFEIALKAGLGGDAGSTPKDDRSHSPHAPPDVDDILSECFDEDRESDEARFGAPSGGFGPPSRGFGPTSSGFGPTSSGFGPTSGGFGPTSSGFGPTSGGFGPTSGGFGPTSGGFGPTSGGFGPTSSGFGPTSGGFGPPSRGFGPTSGGFGPTSSGFGPTSGGFGPPSRGFGPTSGGFGPTSRGFGPTSGGFGPPSRGFGPTSGGFGPTSGGFGPPSRGFGPTSGGFGPTSGGFGPTSSGFGPTSGGFGPTSGGFGPTSSGFGPTSSGFGPTSGGFGQQGGGFGQNQKGGGFGPNTSSATLDLDILLQIPQGSMPVKGGFYTKTLHRRVREYSSEILSYSFYFPEPGEFSHYPAHVMRKERIVAIGKGLVIARMKRMESSSSKRAQTIPPNKRISIG
ncbi:putative Actin-binding protein [Blattamonas nauphoetae]|uniref:Actin-binding protein n=1 Tax=Blattamonas nauphoetae TaxID=2049346 RepID=A0ABQ9WQM5_9EUKA|nr:putative Actin-binding protein [Blattamonas nauphoetae]